MYYMYEAIDHQMLAHRHYASKGVLYAALISKMKTSLEFGVSPPVAVLD